MQLKENNETKLTNQELLNFVNEANKLNNTINQNTICKKNITTQFEESKNDNQEKKNIFNSA